MTQEELKNHIKYMRESNKAAEKRVNESMGLSEKPRLTPEPKYDHVNALENDEATVLYVVGMAVATIFKGNFLLWILFTVIWLCYINRHN